MTATLKKNRGKFAIPKPTLIDDRMRLFLGRRLRDILDHLPHDQDSKLLKRTQKALAKLKTENYGVCEQCNYPIDIGKLLTDPAAEICPCCESQTNCPADQSAPRDKINPGVSYVFPPSGWHS